jgi:integrase
LKNSEAFITDTVEYISEEFVPDSIENIGNFKDICERIKEIDVLPIKNLNIQFSSDLWDFPSMIRDEYQSRKQLRFNFSNVHHKYKDLIKFYIYDTVTRGKMRIQTATGYLKHIRIFVNYLGDNYIFSLEIIDISVIKNFLKYLKDLGRAESTISGYITSIKDLFQFYGRRMTNKNLSDIFKELNSYLSTLNYGVKTSEEDRTPDIPNSYFNIFLSEAIKIMDSEVLNINQRGYACMIVLLSQTGLRVSQVTCLKANAIRKISILDNTKIAYFMEFIVPKRRSGNNSYHKSETILNDLGYRAYTTLVDIYKDHRAKLNTDYLFCPTTITKAPISDNAFSKNFVDFCFENGRKLGCVNVSDKYPELSSYTVKEYRRLNPKKRKSIFEGYKDGDTISYPTTHQFRVHLCTELYFKNIPLSIIQHYMSHLSEEMADYYVRRPEYSAKEEEYANSVLKVIVEEGVTPLGANSNALISKIDEFIEKGEFNVSRDIDTIISQLKRRMPIKEKLGGICIKSGPKRDCSKDAMTDEFYCAYGVCPNHFHLYTMADITYTRCKAILKTMEHNKSNGFTRQSQKEKNKLIHVTKHSFLPELEQLNNELTNRGSEWIKENHPNLKYIVDNYDLVIKEANSWIS